MDKRDTQTDTGHEHRGTMSKKITRQINTSSYMWLTELAREFLKCVNTCYGIKLLLFNSNKKKIKKMEALRMKKGFKRKREWVCGEGWQMGVSSKSKRQLVTASKTIIKKTKTKKTKADREMTVNKYSVPQPPTHPHSHSHCFSIGPLKYQTTKTNRNCRSVARTAVVLVSVFDIWNINWKHKIICNIKYIYKEIHSLIKRVTYRLRSIISHLCGK